MTGMKVIMLINETKVMTMKTIAGSKQHGQIFHILLVSLDCWMGYKTTTSWSWWFNEVASKHDAKLTLMECKLISKDFWMIWLMP